MILTDVEFDILDEVYFVTDYPSVQHQLDRSEQALQEGLQSLLEKGYVQQLFFDKTHGDYVKQEVPDLTALSRYHYLATKEGLLAHNL